MSKVDKSKTEFVRLYNNLVYDLENRWNYIKDVKDIELKKYTLKEMYRTINYFLRSENVNIENSLIKLLGYLKDHLFIYVVDGNLESDWYDTSISIEKIISDLCDTSEVVNREYKKELQNG